MRVLCTDTKDKRPFFQICIDQIRAFVQIFIVIIRTVRTNTPEGNVSLCLNVWCPTDIQKISQVYFKRAVNSLQGFDFPALIWKFMWGIVQSCLGQFFKKSNGTNWWKNYDEKIAPGKRVSLFVSVGWISSFFFWISFQILFDFFRNSK